MHKVSREFDQIFAENETIQKMVSIARAFDPYIPSAKEALERFRENIPKENPPEWTLIFLPLAEAKGSTEEKIRDFYSICSTELNLPREDLIKAWSLLKSWLEHVMYVTCHFTPNITEENAHNMALGHPISLWLAEYVDLLDACLAVGMVCWRATGGGEQFPTVLLRLPILTIRYRMILAPVVNGFNKSTVDTLKEERSKYMNSVKINGPQ